MQVTMRVIDVKDLDDCIDNGEVPFAICTPPSGVTSNRQQRFLDKYYDKVVDRKGWVSYYCNIINARKCRACGYKKMKFANGNEEKIKDFRLARKESVRNGFVVVTRFNSGRSMDALSLVKNVRLDVERIKSRVNSVSR